MTLEQKKIKLVTVSTGLPLLFAGVMMLPDALISVGFFYFFIPLFLLVGG